VRDENPNSLMAMTFSSHELGVAYAALALQTGLAKTHALSGDEARVTLMPRSQNRDSQREIFTPHRNLDDPIGKQPVPRTVHDN
jgi:hypothetical protein